MDNFEVREVLTTFRIIADTREQRTPKSEERFKSFGVPVQRATLSYCDYCGQITLPAGDLYKAETTIKPVCCIERKMNLDELAMCFTRSRDRFRKEFERASEANAKVFLLVEDGSWEAIMNHRYRSRFNEKAFAATLTAWTIRYNLVPLFCRSGTSGTLIREILYRDMKERLERGDFDGK